MFNGKLYQLIAHLGAVQQITEKPNLLSYDSVIAPIQRVASFFKETILAARKNGDSWIYTNEDIEKDGKEWKLPSVEFWFFLSEEMTHNDFPKFWVDNGFDDQGIIWDTESSAIYPRFKTLYHAKKFIEDLDTLIDKQLKIEGPEIH